MFTEMNMVTENDIIRFMVSSQDTYKNGDVNMEAIRLSISRENSTLWFIPKGGTIC